jgi:hypothetical protein
MYYRDTAINIASLTDGHLDITADISVDINTPDIDLRAQATDILMVASTTNSLDFKNASSGFLYLRFDTFLGNIIHNVQTIVDVTNGTEVFLVRKDGDTGDVFAVDTLNSIVAVTGSLTLTTALDETYGGTGLVSYTSGDILYASGANTLARLGIGTKGQVLRINDGATAPEWYTPGFSKSWSLEDPTNAEDKTLFFTNRAITITEMRAVLLGSASPSVTWTIRHQPAATGQGRDDTGAEVVTSGTTTTSITSGDDITTFNDATIPADSFVWLETTAQSGTVDELHVTIYFRETTT